MGVEMGGGSAAEEEAPSSLRWIRGGEVVSGLEVKFSASVVACETSWV